MSKKMSTQENTIADKLIKITATIRVPPEKPKKADPQVEAIERLIATSDFGCKKESVAALMAAVIGKPVSATPASEKEPQTAIFSVVVAERHESSHDYYIGKPFLVTSHGSPVYVNGMRHDGTPGNSCPRRVLRPATNTEIREFVCSFPEAKLLSTFAWLLV